MKYWWMNTDASSWNIFEEMSPGTSEHWPARGEKGRYKAYIRDVRKGDRSLCFQTYDEAVLVAELEATRPSGPTQHGDEAVYFRLKRFIQPVNWSEIARSKIFDAKKLKMLRRPTLSPLSKEQFYQLLALSDEIAEEDAREQEELEATESSRSLSAIRDELRNLNSSDPELVKVAGQTFKRDNKTISQLKLLRNFTCQICGTTIKKKDGSRHIEAAHVTAKRNRGAEMPSNIVILCPNHHKEFDFGDLVILSRSDGHLLISLNGQKHKIDLSI